MNNFLTMDCSILSLLILILIYASVYNQFEKVFTRYKLYTSLVKLNIVMIIIDILGWVFNKLPGIHYYIANAGFNALLYIMAPLAPVLWIIYIDYQIFQSERRISLIKKILSVPIILNGIISVLSIKTGWFFSIDENNVYHRGEYFLIYTMFCYLLILYSFFFIIFNRKHIEKRRFWPMLCIFPTLFAGIAFQFFFYGVSHNWVGMMLSLLVLYFNIQNNTLNIDYLTGAYNRMYLDQYMEYKIAKADADNTFSVIFIDLNNFKYINDNYGHIAGDDVLKESINIIQKCVGKNDFISRFGGDEFLIILNTGNINELEKIVFDLEKSVAEFNENSAKHYEISFCMGYDVYDYSLKMNSDEFFRHIDSLMYKNKKLIKQSI